MKGIVIMFGIVSLMIMVLRAKSQKNKYADPLSNLTDIDQLKKYETESLVNTITSDIERYIKNRS